jgi:hypothetical protein
MARYRKVDPRIWNDAKFRALSDDGKLVFVFLLTHPGMTALGAMRATCPGLAGELHWDPERFHEAFREALQKGMADHDPEACFVSLPNFVKYNTPESPNVVKAWAAALDLLPECELKNRAVARAGGFAKAMSAAFAEALPEAFAKAMANQEQEQEQEPKQEPKQEPPSLRSGRSGAPASGPAAAARPAVDARRLARVEPDAAQPVGGVISCIPLVDGTEFEVRESHCREWTDAYPAVDVRQQLRHMRQWCIANQSRRKTRRGVIAFIVGWLAKEQDKGGARAHLNTGHRAGYGASATADRTTRRMETLAELTGQGPEPDERGGAHVIDTDARFVE